MNIERQIDRLKRSNSPVSLKEVTHVAKHFGYLLDHVNGSHYVFRNWTGRKYIFPVHGNKSKAFYIKNFIKEQE